MSGWPWPSCQASPFWATWAWACTPPSWSLRSLVLYRAGRYSIARPAREVLFTVVDREERYKSKAFIDAAIYRGGDLVNGWAITGLEMIGLTLAGIAFVAVPVMGVWMGVGFYLGRAQEEKAGTWQEEEPTPGVSEAG